MSTAPAPTISRSPADGAGEMITLRIDGVLATVPKGTSVLDAARSVGIAVPALCHREDLRPVAVCRVCCVDVRDNGSGRGERVYPASCACEARDKMVVETGAPRTSGLRKSAGEAKEEHVRARTADDERAGNLAADARRTLVELLLAEHPVPCKRHQEFGDCELEVLGEKLGLLRKIVPTSEVAQARQSPAAGEVPQAAPAPAGPLPRSGFQSVFTPRAYSKGADITNPSIAIDHSACILCDRCVRACSEVAENFVIGRAGKGTFTSIAFDNDRKMGESSCVNCGWCMVSCPTGAITYGFGTQPALPGAPLSVEEIKQIPLFAGISAQFLARSEGGIVLKHYKPGEVICRQGEFGSTAFYIDSGEVEIFLETDLKHVRTRRQDKGIFNRVKSLLVSRKDDDRREEGSNRHIPIDAADVDLAYDRLVATVGQKELIGEAACLNFQPRSATVVAKTDVVAYEMLRNVLDILRRNRRFRAEMDRKYRERALANHLRSVPEFADLPDEFIDELREKVELVSYAPGEVICRQGEAADAFYLVRMGHVRVYQTWADGQGMVLSYLSRSQFFGEIGLLGEVGDGKRMATCSALDHVECVRIGKDEFDHMVHRFPQIRQRLKATAEARLESDRDYESKVKRISLQQFVDDGLYQAQSLLILDLEKCTRCDECVRACADAHDGVTRLIRDGLRYDKYLVTTSCRSCRDPLCMVGCPVGSIRRKGDMEIIIEDHCIGCGRCAEQCPYGNINMHEFDMEVTDFVTGKKRVEPRKKATVCDLCTDQCLGENEDPSCVYACPHDAAHRVDGQSFFDIQVLGARGVDDKTVTAPSAKAMKFGES